MQASDFRKPLGFTSTETVAICWGIQKDVPSTLIKLEIIRLLSSVRSIFGWIRISWNCKLYFVKMGHILDVKFLLELAFGVPLKR